MPLRFCGRIALVLLGVASVSGLAPSLYSGTGATRDPCARQLASLYAFGDTNATGDIKLGGKCDDCFYPVFFGGPTGDSAFAFFGQTFQSLFISNNGVISFTSGINAYLSVAFPLSGYNVIAPFWVDVDTRGGAGTIAGFPDPNCIYYRTSSSPSISGNDTARMAADVAAAFPGEPTFTATLFMAVTWFAVGRYNSKVDALNTFQAVLASDGAGRSFVTLCYDNLIYDAGDATRGTYVNAGFNAGDGTSFYSLPGSFTANDVRLSCSGSTGSTGCYTFRVDGPSIVAVTVSQTLTASATQSSTATPAMTTSQTRSPSPSMSPTQTPVVLLANAYSGSGSARDSCVRNLAYTYPFGAIANDTLLSTKADDASFSLSWTGTPFRFYGTNYTLLYPTTNGAIFLGAASIASGTTATFPASGLSAPVIAVFWNDGSTQSTLSTIAGFSRAVPDNIYYRVSAAPSASDISRMASDVALSLPTEPAFTASSMVVVTWFAIGYRLVNVALTLPINTEPAFTASSMVQHQIPRRVHGLPQYVPSSPRCGCFKELRNTLVRWDWTVIIVLRHFSTDFLAPFLRQL